MARPASRRKQHDVDPQIVTVSGITRGQRLRGGRDPGEAAGIDRKIAFLRSRPPFHLNESNGPPAPGDEVDLSARGLQSPTHDPPAVEPQIPRGQRLASPAATFGDCAIYFSSSARA